MRLVAEKHFSAFVTGQLDVAHLRAHKMADHRTGDAPHKIRAKNERVLQNDYDVHGAPGVVPRNRAAQACYLGCESSRRINNLQPGLHSASSAITKPVRVPARGANSAATGKPRAQTSDPALVNTGHPRRSRAATRLSSSSRFSLRTRRRPCGR